MVFNSIEFLLFLPIISLLFYVLPHKFRWMALLIASCYFYMYFIPQYILIIFSTTIVDYWFALLMSKENTTQRRKKSYLITSVVFTCLILFIFKYFNFFNDNMVLLSQQLGFHYPENIARIALPIGLSFHTFQSLSYIIEVYRGNQKAEKHFGIYSLYVMFFPQLVTGPIERPQNLLSQFRERKRFDYDNLSSGLRLILWGLFAKMVVADNLAVYVEQVYNNPEAYSSKGILTGMFFYSFQIYCDFFGYSTVAIGSAKIIGFTIMDNFRNPYLSKSIGEMWERWHISLSTWFRDYVYFPLGGNRVKMKRWMINILIVFVLSGFWHGANWTFILWGLAHGVIYLIENLIGRIAPKKQSKNILLNNILNGLKIAKTFVLVMLIWVFFRAENIEQIETMYHALLNNTSSGISLGIQSKVWILLALFILMDTLLYKSRFDKWCSKRKWAIRWSIYSIMIFSIIVFSNVEDFPFIYFQF